MTLDPISNKIKIFISVLALVIAFAFGRYSETSKPTIITAEKQVAQTQVRENDNVKTHTVTTKKPDGEVVTVTDSQTIDDKDTQLLITTEIKQTETPSKGAGVNIFAMGGYDFRADRPIYGAGVNKQLLGPITIGLWGLTNGSVGATIGISF